MKYQHFLFLLLSPSLLSLGGCLYTNTPEHANELITDGWVGPTPYPSIADAKPVYCYSTLGDQDCYSRPQLGWEDRLVESYDPETPLPVFATKAPIASYPINPPLSSTNSPSIQPMKLNP